MRHKDKVKCSHKLRGMDNNLTPSTCATQLLNFFTFQKKKVPNIPFWPWWMNGVSFSAKNLDRLGILFVLIGLEYSIRLLSHGQFANQWPPATNREWNL